MIVVYGLKNCDSCRKARSWLTERDLVHRFHDLRADGLPPSRLEAWLAALGWETVLNRRGTTWRQLPEEVRSSVTGETAAGLLADHPALIKRPVFELSDGRVLIGFTGAQQTALAEAPPD
ncbi:ArsC family reductase [Algihabitans albus]|uniref:ArsC family reductase n=1 Tax=Algihabitans albus TaxID=2164067 RepID=UPI000E5D0207|nr:ArsC family reductase [Algihabitans albus]